MTEAEIINKLNDLLRRVKNLENQNNHCCHCNCHRTIYYPYDTQPYIPQYYYGDNRTTTPNPSYHSY